MEKSLIEGEQLIKEICYLWKSERSFSNVTREEEKMICNVQHHYLFVKTGLKIKFLHWTVIEFTVFLY